MSQTEQRTQNVGANSFAQSQRHRQRANKFAPTIGPSDAAAICARGACTIITLLKVQQPVALFSFGIEQIERKLGGRNE